MAGPATTALLLPDRHNNSLSASQILQIICFSCRWRCGMAARAIAAPPSPGCWSSHPAPTCCVLAAPAPTGGCVEAWAYAIEHLLT